MLSQRSREFFTTYVDVGCSWFFRSIAFVQSFGGNVPDCTRSIRVLSVAQNKRTASHMVSFKRLENLAGKNTLFRFKLRRGSDLCCCERERGSAGGIESLG